MGTVKCRPFLCFYEMKKNSLIYNRFCGHIVNMIFNFFRLSRIILYIAKKYILSLLKMINFFIDIGRAKWYNISVKKVLPMAI